MGNFKKKFDKALDVKERKPEEKARTLRISIYGIIRTLILMGSMLLFLKEKVTYGCIGIVIYAVILFLEKRYKRTN